MNSPDYSEDLLHEELQKEYMALIGSGDRKAWDFSLENSDEANHALQRLGMEMMRAAGAELERRTEGSRAPALALWTLCARQSFLDVVEREVAPLWAAYELPKRICMFEEMREEYREYNEHARQ